MNTKNWYVKIMIVLTLLSVLAACSPQNTSMNRQEIESMLIAKEQQKWDMFRAGTFSQVSNLYADDFINVSSSPAGTFRQNKQEADAALASLPPMDGEIVLSDFLVVRPDENTAVVSYKVSAFFGSEYATAVWSQRDGEWVTVFYQGTPIFDAAAPTDTTASAVTTAIPAELVVTFANGTCSLDGPAKLTPGSAKVTLRAIDTDKEGYSVSFVTLPSNKTLDNLIAASQGPNANKPDWVNEILFDFTGPASVKTANLVVGTDPIYAVCFSWNDSQNQPRYLVGYAGPIEVGE